jgi:alpha-L-rhamnosidase
VFSGPDPGEPLRWARGSYRSVRGVITAGWEVSGDRFTYRVELPPNPTATVCVPSSDASSVRDGAGNGPLSVAAFPGAAGVREAVFRAGPGTHAFTGPLAG